MSTVKATGQTLTVDEVDETTAPTANGTEDLPYPWTDPFPGSVLVGGVETVYVQAKVTNDIIVNGRKYTVGVVTVLPASVAQEFGGSLSAPP